MRSVILWKLKYMKALVAGGLVSACLAGCGGGSGGPSPLPPGTPVPGATPTPTVAASLGQITFAANNREGQGLYVMNGDGTNQRLLYASGGSGIGFSAVSPDGRYVAFERPASASSQIFKLDTRENRVTQLTRSSPSIQPHFSPDGSQITYSSFNLGHFNIHVMNANGSNKRKITGGYSERSPVWARNGRIVFISQAPPQELGRSQWSIDAVNANGDQRRTIYTSPHRISRIAVSPDGGTIVFASDMGTTKVHLYVIGANGTGLRQLTNISGSSEDFPSFSPDGRAIVFASTLDSHTTFDLYSINLNGNGLKKLADNGSLPAWGPAPR